MNNILKNGKTIREQLDSLSYARIEKYPNYWRNFAMHVYNNIQELVPMVFLYSWKMEWSD
jgi:hypothetical protein